VGSDYRSPSGLPPLDGPGNHPLSGPGRPSADQFRQRPGAPSNSFDPSGSQGHGQMAPQRGGLTPGASSSNRSPGAAPDPRLEYAGRSGTWSIVSQSEHHPLAQAGDAENDTGDGEIWDDRSDLLAASKAEYEQVNRELDEIRMLIKQSSAELEKLNQRKVLAAAKTREMEERIETFSRQEIRASYLASSEAEMRAFMMGEQREQLVAKEKAFERYLAFLRRTIDLLSALPREGAPGGWGPNSPTWGPAPGQLPETAASGRNSAVELARVIQAQEDVRQRVAQRLHDGSAQALANVVLTAEICEKLVQSDRLPDRQRAQAELGNLRGQVNAALQDTRKFIFELRPMTLDDLGLVPTLRRYCTDVGAKYQVQIQLVAPQGEQRLPKDWEVSLFRVAQEAVANAVQHGRATQMRVTIAVPPDGVLLTVEDNGSGFDVEQALVKAKAHETLGIASMQERAEMLGGWLRIESSRGRGTRVELAAPRHS
jgi:two-component system, NarL family, sensor histidine kinase DegS